VNERGFNPINWNCGVSGCFNRICRPKIEQFSDCLPTRNAFGDVDGITEQNGQFLMLEWKNSGSRELRRGQEIMYQKLTARNPFVVLVIIGNAETMEVHSYSYFYNGQREPKDHDVSAKLEDVRTFIREWCQWAWQNKHEVTPA
jgi:hypothetical protein